MQRSVSRRLVATVLMAVAISPCFLANAAAGGDTSLKDREPAIHELQATRDRLLASIEGMTDAQWNFRPADDKWTAAEVFEHIILAEGRVRQIIENGVLMAPVSEPGRAHAMSDQEIATFTLDRTRKFNAPESLKPTHQWKEKADAIKAFAEARARSLELIRTANGDLRNMWAQHPVLKMDFDGIQWFLFLSGHSARHTLQIEEIKAHPNYPK